MRLLLIGGLIVFAGFLYALFFAGLPYQDPTPDVYERWKLNHAIADAIMAVGASVFLVGAIKNLIGRIRKKNN